MRRFFVVLALLAVGCGGVAKTTSTPSANAPSPAPPAARVTAPTPPAGADVSCDGLRPIETFEHEEIGRISLHRDARQGAIAFASQMAVNTDGAPDSYHPDDIGITHICNGVSVGPECTWKAECLPDFRQARSEGFRGPTKICFFGMVADRNGIPLVQKEGHPKPGFFVSTTALQQPGVANEEPDAYLDSNEIPFVVIPRTWQKQEHHGLGLGDYAVVLRKSTGVLSFAIIGDLGPAKKLGEGSVALHTALGNDPFQMRFGVRRARKGIDGRDVVYVLFPGSRRRGERITKELIAREGKRLLAEFGGDEKVRRCSRNL